MLKIKLAHCYFALKNPVILCQELFFDWAAALSFYNSWNEDNKRKISILFKPGMVTEVDPSCSCNSKPFDNLQK